MFGFLIGKADINWTELVIGLVGIGGSSVAVGWFLMRQALVNFREGRVPLVGSVQLTGIAGRLGAMLLLAFGAMAMAAGAGLVVFILWGLIVALTKG